MAKINAVKKHANKVWGARAKERGFETERAMWENFGPLVSPQGLAIDFNCSPKTIENRMKRHGVKWATATQAKERVEGWENVLADSSY